MLVVLVLLAAAGTAGLVATIAVHRWPERDPASPRVTLRLARWELRHPRVLTFVERRLDPGTATGLALTLSMLLVAVAGVVFGVVAYMVRTDTGLARADLSIARWGADHATEWSTRVVDAVTQLGGTGLIVAVLVVVALLEYRRVPNHYILWFFAAVALGQGVLVVVVKDLVERVRPALGPHAPLGDPSFPSGHAAGTAACYAAIALVVGRRRSPRAQAVLVGIAVGVAVAVATSRVLLDAHWLTDVVAGLAFGWLWFAINAMAFGGRLLHFGAPVELAERAETLHEITVAHDPHPADDREERAGTRPDRRDPPSDTT